MSTKLLAQQLGLVEIINVDGKPTNNHSNQTFEFLLVLDFEATCWERYDFKRRHPEIIEFPAVLYDIKSNNILCEFQQYVLPTEVPILTDFCINLTGIKQKQVDEGVPLKTCLMLFTKWIKEQMCKYNITFDTDCTEFGKKKCACVTWSDWDLNTCLVNECYRKRITKPMIFDKWIDLRALYRGYYNRRPKGLNGALTEVGLFFEGTEHCGLHDARNTAFLAGRMISEGVLLRITGDLSSE